MSGKPIWKPIDLDTLRGMADEGANAREIAKAIGRSRNAVIGQARRKGIMLLGAEYHKRAEKPQIKLKPQIKPVAMVKFVASSVNIGPVTDDRPLYELQSNERVLLLDATDNQCRWIDGIVDGSNTKVCGCQVIIGTSWCAEHRKRAYTRGGPAGGGWRDRYSRFK